MKSNNPVVSQVIKDYSNSQKAFLPRQIIIPLTQEKELTYTCLVNPGDFVKEGEIIAISQEEKGKQAKIHSSLPGKVLEVSECISPSGKKSIGVKIQFGGSFTYLGKKKSESKTDEKSSEIIKSLLDYGIINTFKTEYPENLGMQLSEQVSSKEKKKVIVVRMFDEDPYRITDSLMSKLYFDEIVKGARITASAIGAEGIIFAVDQKFFDLEIFNKQEYQDIKPLEMNIRRYPCGTPREIISAYEKSNIKKTYNYNLKKSSLFTDSCTMYEVFKAIDNSMPCIDRLIHISGNCLYASCLLEVKIGTTLKDLVSQIGGFAKEPSLIVINGLLCGSSVQTLDIPITKYVKSVEFISKSRKADSQMHTCINCGNCRFACPVKLSPDILYNNTVNFKRLSNCLAASSLACIECGLCNTVCPARLPLCQIITILKNNNTEKKSKK